MDSGWPYAPKWQTPVLVTVGERDFRVPLNNTLEYWSVLQRQQIESRLLVFPDENHWIRRRVSAAGSAGASAPLHFV